MANLVVPVMRARCASVMERNASSWQSSFTVNWPIAYGICLSFAFAFALFASRRVALDGRRVE